MILGIIIFLLGFIGYYYYGIQRDYYMSTFSRIIAMGYPFIWHIPNKILRGVAIGFLTTIIFLSTSSLSLLCVLATLLIIYGKKNILIILLIVALITSSFLFLSNYKINKIVREDITGRVKIWMDALKLWEHKLWGEGINTIWKTKPVMDGKIYFDLHNDILQWFIEWGAIRGLILTFLLILPLGFIKDKINLAAYWCLTIQCFTDFPLHRVSTMILGMIIIMLGYMEIYKKKQEVTDENFNRNSFSSNFVG